ncbi:MAG: hypothetical protein O3C21_10595 [Verrucomicrobia bacterium]|nr:hypothetical protein [Verrucomicrobiota bacterium]
MAASLGVHVLLALTALPLMMKAAAAMAVPATLASERQRKDDAWDKESAPVALEIQLPQFLKMVARDEVKDSLINYLRTTQNESSVAPENPAFQSDRNTRAATELSPDEDATKPLPSQEGVDLPVVELATREYIDGEIADDRTLGNRAPEMSDPAVATQPSPSVPAVRPSPLTPQELPGEETPEPGEDERVVEESSPRVFEEDFAQDPNSDQLIATARRPLEIIDQPKETEFEDSQSEKTRPRRGVADTEGETYDPLAEHRPPAPVRPALRPGSDEAVPDIFQPQTRQNEQRGTISNRGASAADAIDTPMGRYMRQVTAAIEKEWNRKRVTKSDFVTYGNIRLKFFVDRAAKVRELRIDNPDESGDAGLFAERGIGGSHSTDTEEFAIGLDRWASASHLRYYHLLTLFSRFTFPLLCLPFGSSLFLAACSCFSSCSARLFL